jgi:hypothetical protein
MRTSLLTFWIIYPHLTESNFFLPTASITSYAAMYPFTRSTIACLCGSTNALTSLGILATISLSFASPACIFLGVKLLTLLEFFSCFLANLNPLLAVSEGCTSPPTF